MEAVIVQEPDAIAVTTPSSTVATDSSEELHVRLSVVLSGP